MNHADAAEAFRDHEGMRDPLLEPELAAVRAAILVEDLMDVVLADEDITVDALADPARWCRPGRTPGTATPGAPAPGAS